MIVSMPATITWRVLLVNREEADYLLAGDMLSEARCACFHLDWCDSYASGLERLSAGASGSAGPYDAALVDFNLDPYNGIDLISAATAGGCAIPLLLVTAEERYEIDIQAMQAGAADYLNRSELTPALLERSIRYAIERKQGERRLIEANAALSESERRLRISLENTLVSVFTQDQDLRYTWIENPPLNLNSADAIGRSDDELFPPGEFFPPDFAAELSKAKRSVLASGKRLVKEFMFTTLQNAPLYYLVTLEPRWNERSQVVGLYGAAVDVTNLRRLEAQKSDHLTRMEVQSRLLEQREMERMQIARSLHDGPVQDLIGLVFSLQSAIHQAPPGQMTHTLAAIREQARQLAVELRTVCNELRPPSLMRFGLEHAIRSHVDEFRQKYARPQIEIDFPADSPPLHDSLRLALFRIYQESLVNAVRHARAGRVTVRLSMLADEVVFEVEDDGQGFASLDDWMELSSRGHLGLLGMKERAEAVGGTLEIISDPGKGACVRVKVPLQ